MTKDDLKTEIARARHTLKYAKLEDKEAWDAYIKAEKRFIKAIRAVESAEEALDALEKATHSS